VVVVAVVVVGGVSSDGRRIPEMPRRRPAPLIAIPRRAKLVGAAASSLWAAGVCVAKKLRLMPLIGKRGLLLIA
jgi:hypothetical protein